MILVIVIVTWQQQIILKENIYVIVNDAFYNGKQRRM